MPDVSEKAFWLGIMRDHTLFIRDNLGPGEKEAVARADALHCLFEDLVGRAATVTDQEAAGATENLIAFKSSLLARQLDCGITLHLEPSDLNHMINEAKEFLRVLGRLPGPAADTPSLLLHLNRIWLADAAGHSAMMYRVLDPLEYRQLMELKQYEEIFNHQFIKAVAKDQMYRAVGRGFPSLYGFINEARAAVQAHIDLLRNLEKAIGSCSLENNGNPLLPNHMVREETYFLTRLALLLGRLTDKKGDVVAP